MRSRIPSSCLSFLALGINNSSAGRFSALSPSHSSSLHHDLHLVAASPQLLTAHRAATYITRPKVSEADSHKHAAAQLQREQQTNARRTSFLRSITRLLYKHSGPDPCHPRWFAIRELTLLLDDECLDMLEEFGDGGGLKGVFEKHLQVQTILDRSQAPLYKVRLRPFDKRLQWVSNHVDGAVGQLPTGGSVEVDEAQNCMPDGVRRFCEDTFESPLEALRCAAKVDADRKWELQARSDGEGGEDWVVVRRSEADLQKIAGNFEPPPVVEPEPAHLKLASLPGQAPPPPPPNRDLEIPAPPPPPGILSQGPAPAPVFEEEEHGGGGGDMWAAAVEETNEPHQHNNQVAYTTSTDDVVRQSFDKFNQNLDPTGVPPAPAADRSVNPESIRGHYHWKMEPHVREVPEYVGQDNNQQQQQQANGNDSSSSSSAAATNTRSSALQDAVQLKVEDLFHFIPSFFVPVTVALQELQEFGYSHEHVKQYISQMKGVQYIERKAGDPDACFLRIHSMGGHLDMKPILDTDKRLERYAPLPSLSRPFLKIMTRPGAWVTLTSLLELAGDEAASALPFRGADALMYFAQLQHIFTFSLERGGMVARRAKPAQLFANSTPCPVFYNQLLLQLNRVGRIPTSQLQSIVPPAALEEMQRCFPSWAAFALAHSDKVVFSEESSELISRSVFERSKLKDASLEDQLETLLQDHTNFYKNKARIRQIRKRLAWQRNPDNPLLDPERLAAAIGEFVPRVDGGHIRLGDLQKAIPDEFKDLLPKQGLIKLLSRYPDKFIIFDFRRQGNAHVMHNMGPDTPLPAGALRDDFSPQEMVAIVVDDLQRHSNKSNVYNLLQRMPMSMRKAVGKAENLVTLMRDVAPESFVFMSSGDLAEVVLVAQPKFLAGGHVADGGGGGAD